MNYGAMMNKTVVVSGGAGGIGLAVAQKLLQAGAQVCVLDRVQPAGGTPCASQCLSITVDVTDEECLSDALEACRARFGPVTNVVAAAGIHASGSIDAMEPARWDDLFEVNVKSVYNLIRRVYPDLQKAGGASVVIVASDQSCVAKPNNFAYGATKAAVAQMVRSLALDFAAQDIRINAVCPGPVDTPFLRNALERLVSDTKPYETLLREELAPVPMKRAAMPEEVAAAVTFLLGPDAGFITGALLPVDGGLCAGIAPA